MVRRALAIPDWRAGGQTERPAEVRRVLDPQESDWNNSTVVDGDLLAVVSKLKHESSGDIVIPASFRIVRTLMEHDLVDEMRLKVFPVVLGAGERLFGETSAKRAMRLVDVRTSMETPRTSSTSARPQDR